jgi:DNA replication protein DnaC
MPVPPCEEWCASVQQEIGGIDNLVKEAISKISVLHHVGTQQPLVRGPRGKGTMLIGKPGTGKTALAAAIAS